MCRIHTATHRVLQNRFESARDVRHLQALEKKGYIARGETTARSIQVIHEDYKNTSEDVMTLPVIGRVAAGMPILAQEHVEDNVQISLCSHFMGKAPSEMCLSR